MKSSRQSHTSKRRAIVKAFPSSKIALPTSPAKKALITRIHRELFGGITKRGRHTTGALRVPHSIHHLKNKRDRIRVSKALSIRPKKRLGNVLITPPGRLSINKQSVKIVRGQKQVTYPIFDRKKLAANPEQILAELAKTSMPKDSLIGFTVGLNRIQKSFSFDLEQAILELSRLQITYEQLEGKIGIIFIKVGR